MRIALGHSLYAPTARLQNEIAKMRSKASAQSSINYTIIAGTYL